MSLEWAYFYFSLEVFKICLHLVTYTSDIIQNVISQSIHVLGIERFTQTRHTVRLTIYAHPLFFVRGYFEISVASSSSSSSPTTISQLCMYIKLFIIFLGFIISFFLIQYYSPFLSPRTRAPSIKHFAVYKLVASLYINK